MDASPSREARPASARALVIRLAVGRYGAKRPTPLELTPAPLRKALGVEIFAVAREVVLVAAGQVIKLFESWQKITPQYRLQWFLADLDGDRVPELYFYGSGWRGRHHGGVCYGPRGHARGKLRCFSLARGGDGMKVYRDDAGALVAVFTRRYPTTMLPHGRHDEAGTLQARRVGSALQFRVKWRMGTDAFGRPKPPSADLQARPLSVWSP